MRNLSIGCTGTDVKNLQLSLNNHPPTDLPPLNPDGIFGPKTLARVKEFQENNGLADDGIVGPKDPRGIKRNRSQLSKAALQLLQWGDFYYRPSQLDGRSLPDGSIRSREPIRFCAGRILLGEQLFAREQRYRDAHRHRHFPPAQTPPNKPPPRQFTDRASTSPRFSFPIKPAWAIAPSPSPYPFKASPSR